MGLWRRTAKPALPDHLAAAVALGRGERILATAPTSIRTGPAWLVATTFQLALLADDEGALWVRPWHEVDQASWQREARTLAVSFVDGSRAVQFPMEDATAFLQVFRERVQASVVAAVDLQLSGPRKARAVIRADLRTGGLLEQVVLGRGTRPSEEVTDAAAAALVGLREEVGLPPAD